MEFDTRISAENALTRQSLTRLSSRLGVPAEEIIFCVTAEEGAHVGQRTLLLGALELGALTGRALRADAIFPDAAITMMDHVAALFERLSTPYIELWLSSRDNSDSAVARDFIDMERALKNTPLQDRAGATVDRFRAAIRAKGPDPRFDVIEDALAHRDPQFVASIIRLL